MHPQGGAGVASVTPHQHVSPFPPGLPAAMHHHKMWQQHEVNLRSSMDPLAPPVYYRTPPPPPLRRMNSFPNFEEEKGGGGEDTESGTRFENAISESEKNVDGVSEMKDAAGDAEGEHDEGSEDGEKKGVSRKVFGFFN
jgi:hypothetical protein